jgi:2-polyprenyl-3-methyl-5-hydroxy-6-metoxy-1,4-benzoquinol methylase
MDCYICGYKLVEVELVISEPDSMELAAGIEPEGFRRVFMRCSNCRVLQSDIDLNVLSNDVFNENYYENVDLDTIEGKFHRVMNMSISQSDNWNRVERFHQGVVGLRQSFGICSSSKLLDIGSGTGVFPAKLNQLYPEWDCTALEPDKQAVKHLRDRVKLDVIEGCLDESFSGQKYGAITFNRVLEHIPNPLDILKCAIDNLEDDGVIYIEVPDAVSLPIYGNSKMDFGSAHVLVYDLKTLEVVCEQLGLMIVNMQRTKEPSGKYTLFAFAVKKAQMIDIQLKK